jgi:glycosyltransferase involved in cell wall biosynthesis
MAESIPHLSIGLPVYNGENYLREALDSILTQTFTDYEVIICDNASNDQTEAICKAYAAKDSRIRCYRNAENIGAARNYNRTFELSRGQYFKWMAHDDLCAPTFLAECISVLENNPDVVLCYSRTILIDENGAEIDRYSDNLDLRWTQPSQRFRVFNQNPGWCNPIFGVIRSEVLKTTPLIGGFSVSDRSLLAELTLHGKFVEIQDYLFYRRIHPLAYSMAYRTESSSAEWYDPKTKGKIIFPRWKRYSAYIYAVRRAPIAFSEKLFSWLYLTDFVFEKRKWTGMVDDFINALRSGVTKIAGRSAEKDSPENLLQNNK